MDAADPLRRGRVVPALQRARRRERPRRALDARREARRHLRRDGTEGLVVVRAVRRLGHRPRPYGRRRSPTPRDLDAGDPDGSEGRGGAAAPPDHRGQRVQRGVPRRGRGARRPSHRTRERGLAGRQHHARQRARRVVRLEGAGAAGTGDGAARRQVLAPRAPRRPARAPAARGSAHRRRALPPAQRADARPSRPRRRAGRRVEPGEAVLGRREPATQRARPSRCSVPMHWSTTVAGRTTSSRRAPTRSWGDRARSSAPSSASVFSDSPASRGRDEHRRRRARPRRLRALRAATGTRTRCGHVCAPRRPSPASSRRATSRSGPSRSTPTSSRSRSSP